MMALQTAAAVSFGELCSRIYCSVNDVDIAIWLMRVCRLVYSIHSRASLTCILVQSRAITILELIRGIRDVDKTGESDA